MNKLSEEEIFNLNKVQLIEFYKYNWHDSQTSFCRMYGINQGDFSRWLVGRKSSKSSGEAVRRYILSTLYPKLQISFKITPSPEKKQGKTLKELLNILNECKDELKTIILIDGNNFENEISIITHNDEYTILFFTKGKCIKKYDNMPWLTVICSEYKNQDAVDNDIAVFIVYLDCMMPKNLSFQLITKDHFKSELKAKFKEASDRILL